MARVLERTFHKAHAFIYGVADPLVKSAQSSNTWHCGMLASPRGFSMSIPSGCRLPFWASAGQLRVQCDGDLLTQVLGGVRLLPPSDRAPHYCPQDGSPGNGYSCTFCCRQLVHGLGPAHPDTPASLHLQTDIRHRRPVQAAFLYRVMPANRNLPPALALSGRRPNRSLREIVSRTGWDRDSWLIFIALFSAWRYFRDRAAIARLASALNVQKPQLLISVCG